MKGVILFYLLLAVALLGITGLAFAKISRVNEATRSAECLTILEDQLYIFKSISTGVDTIAHMRSRAQVSHDKFFRSDEWLAQVMKLLTEADLANRVGKLQEWRDGYWHACYDGV